MSEVGALGEVWLVDFPKGIFDSFCMFLWVFPLVSRVCLVLLKVVFFSFLRGFWGLFYFFLGFLSNPSLATLICN